MRSTDRAKKDYTVLDGMRQESFEGNASKWQAYKLDILTSYNRDEINADELLALLAGCKALDNRRTAEMKARWEANQANKKYF